MSTVYNKRTFLKGSAVDGEYITMDLLTGLDNSELAEITFYDVSGNRVIPSAGTVTVQFTAGKVWRNINDGVFDAALAEDTDRIQPYGAGLAIGAKIILAGVVGADNFEAVFYQSQ